MITLLSNEDCFDDSYHVGDGDADSDIAECLFLKKQVS